MQKRLRTLAALALSVALLSGCSGGKPADQTNQSAQTPQQPSKPQGDQNLVIGVEFEHSGNDPAITYDNSTRLIVAMYENLVTLKKETTEIIPQLAEKWNVSEDGKVYTFNLRKGVKFHDGTDLTAEAVKLSLERMVKINKGPAWMFKGAWEKIDTPDPLTVVLTLKQPDASFLAKLAGPAGPQIISAKAIKEHSGTDDGQAYFRENEAGTGPYTLEKWEKGQQVVLAKFADYWGGWQGKHLDKLIFKYVKEASTQQQLLEKGEIDVAYLLPLDQLKALKDKPPAGVKVSDGVTQNVRYIAIHNQRGPLKDKRVRQAIAYAVDYDGLIKNVWSDLEEPLIGPLPNADPNHFKGTWPYKFDMAKAKALMKEAGYEKGGFSLKLGLYENNDPFKAIAEVLQANLKELGIDVQIEVHSNASMSQLSGKIDTMFDLMPIGNYPDYGDSSSMLGNELASWAWGANGWNFSYYKSDRVDQLLKDVNLTTDAAKRAQMFQEIQTVFADEVPLVPVSTRRNLIAMRDTVQGFYARPMMGNSFPVYDMYKEAK
ncbi:MAG: Peptide/nickel transport system substrate-binding protein [Firmicutes bacterium]|nr:Peptide/nickel transport system substrate-binding protein [Bacillota bacterium]